MCAELTIPRRGQSRDAAGDRQRQVIPSSVARASVHLLLVVPGEDVGMRIA